MNDDMLDAKFDAWADENQKPHGPRCGYGLLPDEMQAFVRRASAAGRNHTTISAFLRAEGHKISPATISRHMRGECNCGRA